MTKDSWKIDKHSFIRLSILCKPSIKKNKLIIFKIKKRNAGNIIFNHCTIKRNGPKKITIYKIIRSN